MNWNSLSFYQYPSTISYSTPSVIQIPIDMPTSHSHYVPTSITIFPYHNPTAAMSIVHSMLCTH